MKRYWKAMCAVLAGVLVCGTLSTMALKTIEGADAKTPAAVTLAADTAKTQTLKVGEKLQINLPDGVTLKKVSGGEGSASGSGTEAGSGSTWVIDGIEMPEGSSAKSPIEWDEASKTITATAVGKAAIAAAAEDGSVYSCEITVSGYAITDMSIKADKDGVMLVGETRTLTANITPDNATYDKPEWESGNPDIITVEAAEDGKSAKIIAHKSGTTKVLLKADGYQTEYEVTVHSEIHLYYGEEAVGAVTLRKGESYQLRAASEPKALNLEGVSWTSSDANVVAVDNTGKLTALAEGKATITATSAEGETETCEVTVSGCVVGGITVDHTVLSLIVGGTSKLNATITPTEAQSTTLAWSSSNSAVARVDSAGNITAVAAGTAVITAAADGKSAVCTVTVSNKVTYTTVTTGGVTGGSGILRMPSAIVPATAVRQYTMPTYVPTATFLTIDTNLDTSTESILTVLKSYQTKATFFVPVGDLYASDDMLRHIAGDGHSIGLLLTEEQASNMEDAIALLDAANNELEVITGTPTRLVRVSGGSAGAVGTNGLAELTNAGYRLWDWNATANEEALTAASSYQAVSSAINRTGIVSIRFGGSDNTAAVLRELLPYMNYCAIPARGISAGDTPICQVTAAG